MTQHLIPQDVRRLSVGCPTTLCYYTITCCAVVVIVMQKDEMQNVISLPVVTSADLILSEPQQVV